MYLHTDVPENMTLREWRNRNRKVTKLNRIRTASAAIIRRVFA